MPSFTSGALTAESHSKLTESKMTQLREIHSFSVHEPNGDSNHVVSESSGPRRRVLDFFTGSGGLFGWVIGYPGASGSKPMTPPSARPNVPLLANLQLA